jgi:hypothetical protein
MAFSVRSVREAGFEKKLVAMSLVSLKKIFNHRPVSPWEAIELSRDSNIQRTELGEPTNFR